MRLAGPYRHSDHHEPSSRARRRYKLKENLRAEHRPRIAHLTAACALILVLGAASAGSASATYNSWAGSAPIDTQAAGEDAGTDGLGQPGGIS